MEIYILRRKFRFYDQEKQEYDEERGHEELRWCFYVQTAINEMRKWQPPKLPGIKCTIVRDTGIKNPFKRTIDYFLEYRNGEQDFAQCEITVVSCISIDDEKAGEILAGEARKAKGTD